MPIAEPAAEIDARDPTPAANLRPKSTSRTLRRPAPQPVSPRQDLVPIPFDAAAAEDGLLPVFLVAGEAIWRDVTGRGFELKLKRDLGALLSWRIEAIEAETFSCVLLTVMEAIAQVAGPEGVMVLDLARVFDEATARTEARRRLA